MSAVPANLSRFLIAVGAVALMVIGGCTLTPAGAKQERERLDVSGAPYARRFEQRNLPELEPLPTWQSVLHRAFLANGDLEASHFEWRAAMERVDQAAGYPNTNLSLGFEYMFSAERMKSWDRTTISAGPDPMQNLSLPMKVAQAGKVAFDEARAAGKRFEAAKFNLQRRVLTAYLDLALEDEKIRIQVENVSLLSAMRDNAASRVQVGAPQQDLLKSETELALGENELAGMRSERARMAAMLNGMLARPADAPLALPAALPTPRPLAVDDARLLALGVERNPELHALAVNVKGRQDALELARLQYLPDINPLAAFTGSIQQSVGAMVSVPMNLHTIRSMVREAKSMLRATEAMARQARSDQAAQYVATLYALRNSEREANLLESRVLPMAQQALASSRQSYAGGSVSLVELIDSQRTLLEVRRLTAEARIGREKRLVELEALAGLDVETLDRAARDGATTAPTTRVSEDDP